MNVYVLRAILQLKDKLKGPLDSARKRIQKFARQIRNVGPALGAVAAGLALIGSQALTFAAGFDQAMRSVQAKSGASGAALVQLTDQAREMGRTTVHSATEAARGQAFLAQAGFETREVFEALPATLALATAGELDLARAADIASNVLGGFNLEASATGRVADVIAKAAASTNTNVDQMGAAMAKAAPISRSAGVSLEATAAAIGRLSDAGIQGEEAGTTFARMLGRLLNVTPKAAKVMAKLGINATDTAGRLLPLDQIVAQLAPHADKTGQLMEIFGARAFRAAAILGTKGAADIRELTTSLEESQDAARSMQDTMQGGLWGAMKGISSIVESAWISFGEKLAPAILVVRDLLAALPGPMQEVVLVGGSLTVVLGSLALLLVALGVPVTAFLSPFLLIPVALAAVVAGLAYLGAKVEWIGKLFSAWWRIVKAGYGLLGDLVKLYLTPFWVALRTVGGWISKLWRWITDGQSVMAWFTGVLGKVAGFLEKFRSKVQQLTETMQLSKEVRRLNEDMLGLSRAGKLTSTMMRNVALAAIQLRDKGEALSTGLIRVVEWYEKSISAGAKTADVIVDIGGASSTAADDTDKLEGSLAKLVAVMDRFHAQGRAAASDSYLRQLEADALEFLRTTATAPDVIGGYEWSMRDAKKEASKFEIAIAGVSNAIGGQAAQFLSAAAAMLEHNRTVEEGGETYSKTSIAVLGVASAVSAIGQEIGGVKGEIMQSAAAVAAAFATGGPIAGAIAAIGEGAKWLTRLFTVSDAEKRGRAAAQAFRDAVLETLDASKAQIAKAASAGWQDPDRALFAIAVRDAYLKVGKSVAEAEMWVRKLWEAEAKGPEAVKAVQKEMQKVLDLSKKIADLQSFDSAADKLEKLKSAAEFFGVELAGALKNAELAASAEEIAGHFHTLLAAGVPLNEALNASREKVQGVVSSFLEMGAQIPAALRPIVEQLIQKGQLLDEEGNKIQSINELEFAPTMEQGIQVLVLSLNELIRTMGGEVPAAAVDFAEGVQEGTDRVKANLDELPESTEVFVQALQEGTDRVKTQLDAQKGHVDQFASQVNQALSSIRTDIPIRAHVEYGGGGGGPGIPQHQGGAFIRRPTQVIVGEAGPEWILNTAQMAGILDRAGRRGGGGDVRVEVDLRGAVGVDTEMIAQALAPALEKALRDNTGGARAAVSGVARDEARRQSNRRG